jgi:sarcosine oxidase subunit delta
MRIVCPHCGERSVDEFTALGAAGLERPADDAGMGVWVDYAYVRENPAGTHRELFHHLYGCRQWLVVERDTRTHAVVAAVPARRSPARETPA